MNFYARPLTKAVKERKKNMIALALYFDHSGISYHMDDAGSALGGLLQGPP
jgi:hypothetical protein